MAAHLSAMPVAQQWALDSGALAGIGAAWFKPAAARTIKQPGNHARKRRQACTFRVSFWQGAQQCRGVGMLGRSKKCGGAVLFHHLAGIHHGNALRHFGNQGFNSAQVAGQMARAAHGEGDESDFTRWLTICSMFDRRLAETIRRDLPSNQ